MWPFKKRTHECKQCTQYAAQLCAVRKLNIDAAEGKPLNASATFEGGAVKLWAAAMVEWFRETGGQNFIVVDMTDPRTGESYSITMQKAGGKTPAQELAELRRQATPG